MSAEARAYRAAVLALPEVRAVRFPAAMRLRVHVLAFPPDRRRRDLDNLNKALLDACTAAGVWDDDSQIDDFQIVRGSVVPGGMITMVIEEVGA